MHVFYENLFRDFAYQQINHSFMISFIVYLVVLVYTFFLIMAKMLNHVTIITVLGEKS